MNLLKNEDSPYLRQHASNPVFWNPWGEEALKKAKDEKKPIFISIGYSTCHWCHVMEREIFEKQEFADLLNKNFISIKIDKEERPDIDKYYQEIYQILNKRAGGWPLSMFLTHQGKPFFAGTYIPPKRGRGMVGFGELLDLILGKYTANYTDIISTSETLANMMKEKRSSSKSSSKKDPMPLIASYLIENFDHENGGFSRAPKFPHHDILNFLLHKNRDKTLELMAQKTLKKMAEGGLYDVVEGGFCRYSVDDFWLVPHFEKMLYDNGLLIQIYTKAYIKYKEDFFKKIAIETADFMIGKMMENSLFYSASDADTEGVEGRYFVYSYDLLKSIGLDEKEIEEVGGSKKGNFEGENIITTFNLKKETKRKLQEIRARRVYPFIDKKIVVFQNAMMIQGLFVLSKIESRYLDLAVKSLNTLVDTFFKNNHLKRTKIEENPPKIQGFLEDYSYLISLLLEGYRKTFNESYLSLAKELLDLAIVEFYEDGIWYFSKGDFPTTADIFDNSYPSPIGVILEAIGKLSLLDENLSEIFTKTVESYSQSLERAPFAATTFARASQEKLLKVTASKERAKKIQNSLSPFLDERVLFVFHPLDTIEICDETSCFLSTKNIEEATKRILDFE